MMITQRLRPIALIILTFLALAGLLTACNNATATPVAQATEAPAATSAPTIVIASPTPAPTAEAKTAADSDEKSYPMAPDFTAQELITGKTIKLSDYRGKIVFLNFWGSWCPPCRAEMPSFEEVYEEYGDQIVIIGVGINDSKGNLISFAKSVGVTYPIVWDRTSEIARHYRIRSLPTTYRIDQKGQIRGVAQGGLQKEQLVKAIEALLAEQ